MAAKKAFRYPHDALRKQSSKIDLSDAASIGGIAHDLIEFFSVTGGLALAHNQISKTPMAAFIVDDRFVGVLTKIVMNPKIISMSHEKSIESEGCLSFPNLWIPVERSSKIEATFDDTSGQQHSVVLEDLAARVFQHELEHLDGKLIVDHVDRRTKFQIRSMMLKGR